MVNTNFLISYSSNRDEKMKDDNFLGSWNRPGWLTSCDVLPNPSATVVEQCNKELQSQNYKTVL